MICHKKRYLSRIYHTHKQLKINNLQARVTDVTDKCTKINRWEKRASFSFLQLCFLLFYGVRIEKITILQSGVNVKGEILSPRLLKRKH